MAKEKTDRLQIGDWRYRRAINLSPATSKDNQVVLVSLTTDIMGDLYQFVSLGGSDLRFTEQDEEILLPYWIEFWNNAGISKVWVRVRRRGTEKIHMYYGNPCANPTSNGKAIFDFFDDFDDAIWTKFKGNPVMTRTQLWWEEDCLCEPNIIYDGDENIFKMWYAGWPSNSERSYGVAVGYATSRDGFSWTKYPHNPVLSLEQDSVKRPYVIKHTGLYYLFAVDKNEYAVTPENPVIPPKMRRWVSTDGIHWGEGSVVLTATEPWEHSTFGNMSVVIDDDGTWRMLYQVFPSPSWESNWGYAYSRDGVTWKKYEGNPITDIPGGGGDPFLTKVGDTYYTWYSVHFGDLFFSSMRICCSWSKDMIHWYPVYNNPQIGYTQPWEHGTPPEKGGHFHWGQAWHHLTDLTLCEAKGKVFMSYQACQTPFGMATFDGNLVELARSLGCPPLSQWAESAYGMAEDKTLKISDPETQTEPLYENVAEFSDQEGYVVEYCAQCYAGLSHRAQVLMRFMDKANFAYFWIKDNATTYYQERIGGVYGRAENVGSNNVCDAHWHSWKIVVAGNDNKLFIDGEYIGQHKSSSAFTNRSDLRIGVSAFNTYASFDDIRVRKGGHPEPVARIGCENNFRND